MHIVPNNKEPFSKSVGVRCVGCSRHASRDTNSTNEELDEIRRKGYQVHGAVDICFRSRYLITNEDIIEVQGPHSSGEVEFVAMSTGRNIYISVGSDHNDRSLNELWTASHGKVYDTAKSKQMVPAVVAKDAWPYEDVKDHWDEITLRSSVTVSGKRIRYQEFRLAVLLDLESYLTNHSWVNKDGSIILGGSSGNVSGIPETVFQGQSSFEKVVFPTDFHFEMHDPVLKRTITHGYSISVLEEPNSLSL